MDRFVIKDKLIVKDEQPNKHQSFPIKNFQQLLLEKSKRRNEEIFNNSYINKF